MMPGIPFLGESLLGESLLGESLGESLGEARLGEALLGESLLGESLLGESLGVSKGVSAPGVPTGVMNGVLPGVLPGVQSECVFPGAGLTCSKARVNFTGRRLSGHLSGTVGILKARTGTGFVSKWPFFDSAASAAFLRLFDTSVALLSCLQPIRFNLLHNKCSYFFN